MRIYDIQNSFARGELSPRLHARTDIDHYRQALKECTNFIVLPQGTLKKRSGSQFIAEVKTSSKKTRLVPFVFSSEQAYMLEFGDLYFRIYADGGRVESGGAAVEIATPYREDELFELQFAQSADTLYLAHKAHGPRKITRTSDTAWTITKIAFEDGPFLPQVNATATFMQLNGDGNVIPAMTGLNAPAGTVASSKAAASAWQAGDRDKDTSFNQVDSGEGWWEYDAGAAKTISGFFLTAGSSGSSPNGMPQDFVFQGFDGSAWVTLFSRLNEGSFTDGETRWYPFENETAYQKYRLKWTRIFEGATTVIAEVGFKESPDTMAAVTLTASAVGDINNDQGFKSCDVGRAVRLRGSDGKWRWFKIEGFASSTTVTGVLYGQPMIDLEPTTAWRLGGWSEETGYPGSVTFFEERLVWARSNAEPQKIWGSKTFGFEDHGISSPLLDDDAFAVEISSDQVNEIKWIVEASDLVMGTSSAIRTLGPGDSSKPFSASNLRQRRQTTIGAAALQPVFVGNVTLYADKISRSLRELFFSFEGNSFIAPELTILSEHLLSSGITAMAYAGEPEPIVWIVTGDGGLVSLTFERDQKIVGLARHTLGASATGAAVVESIATLPGASSSEVWLLVQRTVDGVTKRYVERLAPLFDGGSLAGARFLDSHLVYNGAATGTVSGLSHLEGEMVGILADGVVLASQSVVSGSITLAGGITASEIAIGLAYESSVQQLRPALAGNDGSLLGRRSSVGEVLLDVQESLGLRLVGEGVAEEVFERHASETFDAPMALRDGAFKTNINPGWTVDGTVRISSDQPLPAEIRAITRGLEIEP